jgi:signal transduction histidine kinase
MKHPSIRLRLTLGTGLLVMVVLLGANIVIYRGIKRTLMGEVETQLLQSASILAKSAELEDGTLDYEWQEAMETPGAPDITGVFQFWDLNSSRITKSPELGNGELPFFHGKLNQPVVKTIVLSNGEPALAVGLLHHPFTDEEAVIEGKTLRPEDYPQVVVCARETDSVTKHLHELRDRLTKAAIGTLLAIWIAIFAIFTWCLRPIREFNHNLLKRSEQDEPPKMAIPKNLPAELVGLASTFNLTLDRVEKSRAREKEFAVHAAHELRTPVAGILATLEQALHRPRDSGDLLKRIGEALNITSGMRLTLDSLMRLARLRGGLERRSITDFDPLGIIDEVIASATENITRDDVSIVSDFPSGVAPLSQDAGLFRIMVSNLIENALYHCPSGSEVHFRIIDSPAGLTFITRNRCEELTATDTERLFEPFQRGSVASNESGHAGLGLSLAKEAARLLGGTLTATVDDCQLTFAATVPR